MFAKVFRRLISSKPNRPYGMNGIAELKCLQYTGTALTITASFARSIAFKEMLSPADLLFAGYANVSYFL